MKKNLILLSMFILIVILATSMTACSSSEKQPKNSSSEINSSSEKNYFANITETNRFVGTWKHYYTDTTNDWTFEHTIELKSDGTYHYVTVKNGNLTIRDWTEQYSVDGNEVSLYEPDTNKKVWIPYIYENGKLVNSDDYFSKVD